MIPDYVKESLAQGGQGAIASRDAKLRPIQTRTFGVKVHPNDTTVTCYIDELRSEQMIANFENNGRVALTFMDYDNDSYQLKGKFVSWRQNNKQDDEVQEEYKVRVREGLGHVGIPEEITANWGFFIRKPGVAITFDVEKVFEQAAHPDTGKLISGE